MCTFFKHSRLWVLVHQRPDRVFTAFRVSRVFRVYSSPTVSTVLTVFPAGPQPAVSLSSPRSSLFPQSSLSHCLSSVPNVFTVSAVSSVSIVSRVFSVSTVFTVSSVCTVFTVSTVSRLSSLSTVSAVFSDSSVSNVSSVYWVSTDDPPSWDGLVVRTNVSGQRLVSHSSVDVFCLLAGATSGDAVVVFVLHHLPPSRWREDPWRLWKRDRPAVFFLQSHSLAG